MNLTHVLLEGPYIYTYLCLWKTIVYICGRHIFVIYVFVYLKKKMIPWWKQNIILSNYKSTQTIISVFIKDLEGNNRLGYL